MIVSTILLTADNQYVKDDGSLPARPDFDKKLLTELCRGELITDEAHAMLPRSISSLAWSAEAEFKDPTIGITIREIAMLTKLLIVVRSTEWFTGGRVFRLDNFEQIVKDRKVELWVRKPIS